ncbi:MAG TPA: BON domain-containing protein [Kofleriaceae bacterium]|nr:BON domain-containing protein [Kofleriaceae bacterium]
MKTSKSDAQIKQDVVDELTWDTRLSPTEIGVAVENSVVTLTGTVSNFGKKLAAEDAAHRVGGVLDVANDIVVKVTNGAQRSDTDIAAAIRQVLIWDAFIPEEKIQTTVTNGLVTLRGDVETVAQRQHVARVIGNLIGVRGIDNLLLVKRPDVSASALRLAIRSALERHADHDAEKIDLDVEEGCVTISGAVHSSAEREVILGAARGTRGVDKVIDHLHISP